MPVVAVTGPRQSGKSTLCRLAFPDKPYVSFERLDVREFAQDDPRAFLEQYADGAVLDEIQRVPDLFSYLQVDVDECPEPGRFVLTGSQHFGLTEEISQSLAGRIALLNLLPPSLDELRRFETSPSGLWETLFQGAYPRIHDLGLEPTQWLGDYVSTYVQRDVRQVRNVTDLDAFSRFLRLVAGRTSCEVHRAKLGADAGVASGTVRSWLSVLAASFVVFTLPAWHRNVRKQAVKAPKVHFFDSGLVCYLLGVTEPDQLRVHPLRGAVFESWVASEVYKARVHAGREPRLFHLRDAKGLEVDLVLDQGVRAVGVEAKSGKTVNREFFKGLRGLRRAVEAMQPDLTLETRLVYGGDAGQRRTDTHVVPWGGIQDVGWI